MKKETSYRNALESFDIEDLNMCEKVQFEVMTRTMTKFEALDLIIKSTDFINDLNPTLAEIADEYV